MMLSRTSMRAGLLGTALALVVRAASGQSYGPESQRLTVGAAEFRMLDRLESFIGLDGYISVSRRSGATTTPTNHYFLAPLSLPAGATIEQLCMYAYDTDAGDEVSVSLFAVKLTPFGEESANRFIGPLVESVAGSGYRRYCADVNEVLRGRIDVDEDGIVDHAAYYLWAHMWDTTGIEFQSLGGVQVTWKRDVRPAPPTPSFADVPNTHPFFPFIEALAASGVTGGCGDENFCPDALLTRGQMAVFLSKALGLHWEE